MRKFAWVPLAALLDPRLSDRHIRGLLALGSFANLKTGEAFPSQTQIGKRADRKRQAVNALFRELRELGYVEWEPQADKIGRRTSNRYRILFEPATETPAVASQSTDAVAPTATPILEQTISNKNRSYPVREASPLDEDWVPDRKSKGLAASLGFDDEAFADQRILFIDYWTRGDRKLTECRADWNPQFRNYLREQAKRQSSTGNRPRNSPGADRSAGESRRRQRSARICNRLRAFQGGDDE